MEYLKRSHKAKEADIEHTKKLVEEQAARLAEAARCPVDNDPESVTSSLTDSTARSTSPGVNEESMSSSTSSGDSREDNGSRKNTKKRKKVTLNEVDMQAHQASNKKSRKSSSRGKKRKAKEGVAGTGESSAETSSMSEEDDALGNESPGGKNISFDKTSSSVSDMTDSNRSSTDGGGANAKGRDGDGVSTSSISSTAAVVRGVGSSQNTGPSGRHRRSSRQRNLTAIKEDSDKLLSEKKEIVVCTTPTKHKKKRRGFHYDYREVFLKSNVPQLIATLSGRIVVCE